MESIDRLWGGLMTEFVVPPPTILLSQIVDTCFDAATWGTPRASAIGCQTVPRTRSGLACPPPGDALLWVSEKDHLPLEHGTISPAGPAGRGRSLDIQIDAYLRAVQSDQSE